MIAEAPLVLTVLLGFEVVELEDGFAVCGPADSVVVVVVVVGRGGFKDALMPDGAGMLIDGDELRVRRVDERRAFICII